MQLNTYPSSTPIVQNGSHADANGKPASPRPPTEGTLREVDFAKVSISEALSVLKVRTVTAGREVGQALGSCMHAAVAEGDDTCMPGLPAPWRCPAAKEQGARYTQPGTIGPDIQLASCAAPATMHAHAASSDKSNRANAALQSVCMYVNPV